MSETLTDKTPRKVNLNNQQAAEYLCLSPRTLEGFRVRGGGPRFCRAGRRVVYRLEDLDAWLEEGRRRSTSDRGEVA